MRKKKTPIIPDDSRPEIDFEHGWAEHRNVHPDDIALRARGFILRARGKGEALWAKKDGPVMTKSEAMASSDIVPTLPAANRITGQPL